MSKRFVVLSLITALLLVVTACAAPAQAPATGEQQAGGEEAAAEEGPIKIGLEVPLTGDYAYEGEGMEQAVSVLVEETNAEGGLLGRKVELIVEDDKGDPKEAALVADRLVSQDVIAVIGAYNSTATEAAQEIYNEAGILHVTPSSTATRLSQKGYENFFRTAFLDDKQGLFAANFMVEEMGAEKVGVLHDNSTYAKGLAEWTQKYLEDAGANVAFFDAINPKDKDFTPILTSIKDADLDAIYFTGYHAQGGLLLRQSADLELDVQWLMGNASNNPELIEIAGQENAEGTIVTTEPLPNDLPYELSIEFIDKFEEQYGTVPTSVWWVMAADAYRVVEHAIKETESTDPAELIDYLHNEFDGMEGITGPIEGFDEKGDRLGTIHKAYVINAGGEFVPRAQSE